MVYNIHKLNTAVATVNIYYVPAVSENVVNGLFIYLFLTSALNFQPLQLGVVEVVHLLVHHALYLEGTHPFCSFAASACDASAEGGGGAAGGGGGVGATCAAAHSVGRGGVGGPSSPLSIDWEYLIVSSLVDISI